MSDAYTISLNSRARRSLHTLPANVADAALAFVSGPLASDPRRVGHPLHSPFEGQGSAHLSTYRVLYRIDEENRTVVVLDIVGRADAYLLVVPHHGTGSPSSQTSATSGTPGR